MQQTSKWQTQLPYLHLETLRVHNSFSQNYKNSNQKNQHTDAILCNKASQICACVESCGKVQGHFLWDAGAMNATINSQQLILLLKFARNPYLGSKKAGYMINKWQFCAAKLARKANYASGALFGKCMKIVRTHEKNSGETVRRLGTIIQSIFLCPIRSRHPLDFFGNSSARVGTQGLFRRYMKTFIPPFLLRDWLPLGLRGWYGRRIGKKVYYKLSKQITFFSFQI